MKCCNSECRRHITLAITYMQLFAGTNSCPLYCQKTKHYGSPHHTIV